MSEERNLGSELIRSVAEPNLLELATEIGEVALDSLFEDGIVRDIPMLGWLFKLNAAQQGIRDRLFTRKIAAFFSGACEASSEERYKFRKKIQNNKGYQKKVGESLLLLIERHERFEKSLLLGRLFAAFMRNEFSHEVFMRLSAALDKSVIEDLESLHKNKGDSPALTYSLHEQSEALYRCGLMDLDLSVRPLSRQAMELGMQRGIELERQVGIQYRLNELGNLFIKHAIKVDSDLSNST